MAGIASIVLIIHIMVAIAMIGVILLQKSEGGALGGLGGGSGAFMSARSAGNVLTRTTTILVTIFFITSLLLTILGRHTGPKSLNLQQQPASTGTLAAPEAAKPEAPAPAKMPDLPDSNSGLATQPPASAPANVAPPEPAAPSNSGTAAPKTAPAPAPAPASK